VRALAQRSSEAPTAVARTRRFDPGVEAKRFVWKAISSMTPMIRHI
jgi:hypothetical protein